MRNPRRLLVALTLLVVLLSSLPLAMGRAIEVTGPGPAPPGVLRGPGAPLDAAAPPVPSASAPWGAPDPLSVPLPQQVGEPSEKNGIVFDCPEKVGPRVEDEQVIVIYGCPLLVADDGDLFGNMRLAVNPQDPREVALFTLHGGATRNGPHPYSRTGQAHTTFVSYDEGISWGDNPTDYGRVVGDPREQMMGASATGVMDSEGNIYIGYLWSDIRREGGHTSSIALFKAADAQQIYSASGSYGAPEVLQMRPGDLVTDIELVRVAATTPWNDTRAQANETDAEGPERRDAANRTAPTPERIVAVWHEVRHEPENETGHQSGRIRSAVTGTGAQNDWKVGAPEDAIGPCKDMSDPVSWDGLVYVACVVGRGYDGRGRALVGDIDIWSIEPETGRSRFVDTTTLYGDAPALAVNSKGYFVLAAHRLKGAHEVEIEFAFSIGGERWFTGTGNMGPEFHRFAGARPILDARITAMTVSDVEKTVVLVYKERHNVTAEAQDAQGDTPSTEEPPGPYTRTVIALNECAIIGAAVFQLGTGERLIERYVPNGVIVGGGGPAVQGGTGVPEAAFDDIKDGLAYVRLEDGRERVHFAINDFGAAQYGRILLEHVGAPCDFYQVPPALPQAIPIPQAVSVGNAAQNVLAAGTGIFSAAMVGYLLTVKRRHASFVAAEAKE